MAVKVIDRRVGSGNRPKMTGHEGELLSEYFNFEKYPHKMVMKVTRAEFLAILDRYHRVDREQKWYRRLWRILKAPIGSGPITIPEEKKPEVPEETVE